MKKLFWIVMAICAVMLTGCEKSAGNDLVKLPENGSHTLSMYYYNGEKTFWGHLFDDDAASGILDSLAAVSAERAEDWSPADVSFPVYGVKLGMGDDCFEAAWSNGYWITRTGEAYRFEYDFAALWEDYDWEGAENTWSTAAILPCSYYFCRDENGWIADYLPPAGNLPEIPETLAVSVSKLDGDVLTIEFTNSGEEEWSFGERFELQAQLDGEWYNIPALPGDWSWIALGYLVMPKQTLTHDYDLNIYGALPEDNYRIVTDTFSAEFYLNASGGLANFSNSEPNTADTASEEVLLSEKVTVAAVKLEGGLLTVKITNTGRDNFSYGKRFAVQKQENGKWQEIPILPADWKYDESECVVKKFSAFEHTYDLSIYGELSDGKYRLVTDKFSTDFYIDNSKKITYFYQDENGEWIAGALEAADAPPAMDGISAIVEAQDEDHLKIRLTNWGYKYGEEAFNYGAPYHVEVFLGKRWYIVPTKDIDFGFLMPLYSLSNGETKELFYDFFMYDPFPEGRYRVVNDGDFWVEFNAGTKIIPQNSLADGVVRSVTISYYDEYIDGSNSVIMEYVDKSSEISEILSVISANPAEKVDNWSGSMVKAPIFGISATDANGWAFEGAWTNGYWINQNGEAYRLDLDIMQLKRRIVQYESKTIHKNGSIAWLCCGTHLCKDENGWIADFLRPADELPEAPENVTAEITEQTENSVTVQYTNNDKKDWTYGNHFNLDVLLDGEWYDVPPKPGNWGFTDVGINLPAGKTQLKTYNFFMYGDLPSGRYRIAANDFALEFDYNKEQLALQSDDVVMETEIPAE